MFIDVLAKAGVTSMVRASKGVNISAACGQLRRRRVG
jgi:adenine C2-methylase RlmN of 23S rRNA A2503 and tRNA A37